jgi:hypothetical protein
MPLNYLFASAVQNRVVFVGSEDLTAVAMNVTILWDIAPCSPYVNRRFKGTYHLHLQGRKSAGQETSIEQVARQLLHARFLLG